jgi:hypothetical protein
VAKQKKSSSWTVGLFFFLVCLNLSGSPQALRLLQWELLKEHKDINTFLRPFVRQKVSIAQNIKIIQKQLACWTQYETDSSLPLQAQLKCKTRKCIKNKII